MKAQPIKVFETIVEPPRLNPPPSPWRGPNHRGRHHSLPGLFVEHPMVHSDRCSRSFRMSPQPSGRMMVVPRLLLRPGRQVAPDHQISGLISKVEPQEVASRKMDHWSGQLPTQKCSPASAGGEAHLSPLLRSQPACGPVQRTHTSRSIRKQTRGA